MLRREAPLADLRWEHFAACFGCLHARARLREIASRAYWVRQLILRKIERIAIEGVFWPEPLQEFHLTNEVLAVQIDSSLDRLHIRGLIQRMIEFHLPFV